MSRISATVTRACSSDTSDTTSNLVDVTHNNAPNTDRNSEFGFLRSRWYFGMSQLLRKVLLGDGAALIGLCIFASAMLEGQLLACHLLELLHELAVAEVHPGFLCHNSKVVDMCHYHGIQVVEDVHLTLVRLLPVETILMQLAAMGSKLQQERM